VTQIKTLKRFYIYVSDRRSAVTVLCLTDRQTDRQTDGHADRDRQTDRRTDRSNEETVRSSRRCRSSWPHTTSHDELTRRHDNGIHRRHRRRDDDDILRLIRQEAARAADTPTLTATQCLYEFITSDYSQSQTVYVTSCRRQDQTLHDHLHHCITLITEHYSINPQTLTAAKINPRQDDVSFGYKTVKQLSNMATGSESLGSKPRANILHLTLTIKD